MNPDTDQQSSNPQTENPKSKPIDSNTPSSNLPSGFDLFKPSWEALKLNLNTFLALLIGPFVLGLVYFVTSAPKMYNGSTSVSASTLLVGLAFFTLFLLVEPALVFTQVKSAQAKKISLGEAWSGGLHYFWRLYGLIILVAIMIIGGLILLIVPGLFMIRRYLLAPYMMISDDIGISETMEKSKVISKQYSPAIWNIFGVELLIGIIGIIPFIGRIISWILSIVYSVAPAIRYEQIKALSAGSSAKNPVPVETL